ncbi:MAG: flagellar hook-basal body complex protein FliE [Candidatus Omnitrophica bacterium]|nr:flagellar hook-basal body complex protein FliE [Candidatus Omnitrophota bacterium]
MNEIDIRFPALKEIYQEQRQAMVGESSQEGSFLGVLQDKIGQLNENFTEVNEKVENFLLGRENIESVMTSMQKVNLEFRMAVQLRNKLVEAYQEIFRMQV